MAATAGVATTYRFSFTTRALTAAEETTYLAGGGLPAGIGVDVSAATVEYRLPGVLTASTLSGGSVLHDATGAYHVVLTAPAAGILYWKAIGKDGSGNVLVETPWNEEDVREGSGALVGRSTVAELVAAVLEDGQFDVTETQALRALSTRHYQLCARSRCFRRTLDLGAVVEGQSGYALPRGVVEVLEVRVGGMVYGQARHRDYAEGERGWIWLGPGEGGVAGREDDEAGTTRLRIYPTPKAGSSPEPGAEVSAWVVMLPGPLVVGDDATIKVPDNFFDALVSGAIATLLLRDESRADLAQPHEQIFAQACAELTRQTNRKFRGPGAATIRVRGINA